MATLRQFFCTLLVAVGLVPFSSCAQSTGEEKLDTKTFNTRLKATTTAQLVDVRTPDEYNEGHIPGSVNIDYKSDKFQESTKTLDKDKPVFVYCHSGRRSAKAASYMRSSGFKQVLELKDGIADWQAQGLPVTK